MVTIEFVLQVIKDERDRLNDLSTKYEGTENGLKYQYKYLALRDIYNALTQYEE